MSCARALGGSAEVSDGSTLTAHAAAPLERTSVTSERRMCGFMHGSHPTPKVRIYAYAAA